MSSAGKSLPLGLGIGPMRTGSTWLHEYLLLRNDVCLPKNVKETFFFAENFVKGESWYRNHFRHYDPAQHRSIIEVGPTLFNKYDAIERVKSVLHEPVLVATLRDPIDRAWSHYMHVRQYGETTLGFDSAVRELPSIVEPGLYAEHLSKWLDGFGPDAVRALFFDDLKERQAEYVRRVDNAFGLPPLQSPDLPGKEVNSGQLPHNPLLAKIVSRSKTRLHDSGLHWIVNAGKRLGLSKIVYGRPRHTATRLRMSQGVHSYLVDRYSRDVENLERLLNIDLGSWRRKWTMFGEESRQA